MSFPTELQNFAKKTKQINNRIHVRVVQETHKSVTIGHKITGAKGQPVRFGVLRNSFRIERTSPYESLISTNVIYANIIEDALHGIRLRSKVGGFHSVKTTRAAWQRLVDWVAEAELKNV